MRRNAGAKWFKTKTRCIDYLSLINENFINYASFIKYDESLDYISNYFYGYYYKRFNAPMIKHEFYEFNNYYYKSRDSFSNIYNKYYPKKNHLNDVLSIFIYFSMVYFKHYCLHLKILY